MIDLHSHVLPSLDDGPSDVAGSIALAVAAVAQGTKVMAATPHINSRYQLAPRELAGHVEAFASELELRGVPLRIVSGGELAPARAVDLSAGELDAVTLGKGSCVLLECPFMGADGLLAGLVSDLQNRGYRVLLAHPERSSLFLGDEARLATFVHRGAFVQVTASSLRGDFGRRVRLFTIRMLQLGLVHVVASDAHDAENRSPEIASPLHLALEDARLPDTMAGWLTHDVPSALLTDAPLPPLPAAPAPRRRRWRTRRLPS